MTIKSATQSQLSPVTFAAVESAPAGLQTATKSGAPQDAFAGTKAAQGSTALFGTALGDAPQTDSDLQIAHGFRGHRFTDGESAGLHSARHVQEVFGPDSLGIRQGSVLGEAEDIMNGVTLEDNGDSNTTGERQEAVNAFNDEMGDQTYRTPLTQGAQPFGVAARLLDGEVDVYTYAK